jgi:hypothetical protein
MTTLPTSDAHAAEQATPAATAVQTIAEPVPSVVGASSGLLAPGVSVRVDGVSGQWVVAQPAPGSEERYMLWGSNGRLRATRAEISLLSSPPNPQALRDLGSSWLHELVAVLGPEQVQALSGEVA